MSRLYVQRMHLLFVCNLTLLGYDRVLEKRVGVRKSLGIFCKQESGNPVFCDMISLYLLGRGFQLYFAQMCII